MEEIIKTTLANYIKLYDLHKLKSKEFFKISHQIINYCKKKEIDIEKLQDYLIPQLHKDNTQNVIYGRFHLNSLIEEEKKAKMPN